MPARLRTRRVATTSWRSTARTRTRSACARTCDAARRLPRFGGIIRRRRQGHSRSPACTRLDGRETRESAEVRPRGRLGKARVEPRTRDPSSHAAASQRVGISDAASASPTRTPGKSGPHDPSLTAQPFARESLGPMSRNHPPGACDLPCVFYVTPDRGRTERPQAQTLSSMKQRRMPWTTRRTSSSPGCTSRM